MGRPRASSGCLVGVLIAALLAACGGGDGGGDGAATTTALDGSASGGRLRMGIARLSSLDPALVSPDSPSASIAADLLFDGLTYLPPGALTAEPALATGWSSDDGAATWRFAIDPEATFSDGTPVTAADAELSLERVVSLGQASLTASRLDAVTGAAEFLAAGGRGAGADLAGITAIDAATLQITLQRPMAGLPELLAAPVYGVVSSAGVAADGEAFGESPSVSSGPFQLTGRDGDVLSLDRAPGRTAMLDGVDLRLHDDLADAYTAFTDGELDWTLVAPAQAATVAEESGTEGFVPFQAEYFYGFNLADPLFADVRFRQAIVQAVDRQAIVDALYPGVADPLAGVVPAGVPGADRSRCAAGCAYDTAATAVLLAQAFPDGTVPEVPIDFPEGGDEAAVAAVIEQHLEAAGIPATLRPHPAADYVSFAVSGQQGLASLGWIGVQATPEDYLDRLFRTGSPDNTTGFSDAGVDALLAEAAATLDPATRVDLLGQAETLVLGSAAVLPIAQFRVLTVQSDRVEGLELSVTGTFNPTPVNVR